MSSSKSVNSIGNTIKVALGLCIVCSVVISSAAVMLRPMQTANELLDRNRNILAAAGLFDPAVHSAADVPELFDQFTARMVDLETGTFLSDEEMTELGLDPQSYDMQQARNDPAVSRNLTNAEDVASIRRRANYATVFLIPAEQGEGYETVVLPVSGYGLWGIMYGYLALEGDGDTVRGIGFNEHQETPGLGGEIDNPRWLAQWPDKEIYGEDGNVQFEVVKGGASSEHEVDALSGATLTSRGVENLIHFWMGDLGFGPFLENEIRG
ncbi:MAG: Na(+)-translocating NADH-quinone reductase subunit C [Pseudomonadota bacterium]